MVPMKRPIPTMISAASTWSRPRRQGFTLLETVLAMSLMILILGVSIGLLFTSDEEEVLREAATEIEAMATQAHAQAVLLQKPFKLRFEPGRVVLLGAASQGHEGEDEGEQSDNFGGFVPIREFRFAEDYDHLDFQVGVRGFHAADDDWRIPQGNDESVDWRFSHSGLCEPVSIRVQTGDSWIELDMHPLTAQVRDERINIQ